MRLQSAIKLDSVAMSRNCSRLGRPKSWYIDMDQDKYADELIYLRQHIYGREVDLRIQRITALERFSVRG